MTGFLIIASLYLVIAFLLGTFLFALGKIKIKPDFNRIDGWGNKQSWRSREYQVFWLGMSGLIWPLWIPVLIVVFLVGIIKPLFKSIVSGWEYLIKEVINPRENV